MVVRLSLAAICASLWSLVPSVAMAADVLHEKLTSLAQDITYSSAALLPMNATYLGIPNYDAELNVPTRSESTRLNSSHLRLSRMPSSA